MFSPGCWKYCILPSPTVQDSPVGVGEKLTFPWLCSRTHTGSPATFGYLGCGWRPLDGIPLLTKTGSNTAGHQRRDQQDGSLQYFSGIEKWHAISLPQQVDRDCQLAADIASSTASSHNSLVAQSVAFEKHKTSDSLVSRFTLFRTLRCACAFGFNGPMKFIWKW